MTPTPQQYNDGEVRLPRVSIDPRLPLWGLLGAAAALVMGLVGMYYQLDQVGKDVIELKATVRANNAETIKFAQEQALLKFRVEKLEQEKAR